MSQTIVKKERVITAEIPLKSRTPLVELIRSVPNNWERMKANLLRKPGPKIVNYASLEINLSYPQGVTTSLDSGGASTNYLSDLLTILSNKEDPRLVKLFLNSPDVNEGMALQKAIAGIWARKPYIGSFRILRKKQYEQFPSGSDPSPERVMLDIKGVVGSDDELLAIRAEWFIGIGGKKENLWWIVKALRQLDIPFVNGKTYEPGKSSEDDSHTEARARKYLVELIEGLPTGIDKNSLCIYVDSHGFLSLDDVRDFLVDSMFQLREGVELYPSVSDVEGNKKAIAELQRQIALVDGLNKELAKR